MSRKAARETAMKLLFENSFDNKTESNKLTDLHLTRDPDAEPVEQLEVEEEDYPYLDGILAGFQEHQSEVDHLIEQCSIGWKLSRMSRVDTAILRLAVLEILYTDVPKKVAINEAVALARRYSTTESRSFINGLLAKVEKPEGI